MRLLVPALAFVSLLAPRAFAAPTTFMVTSGEVRFSIDAPIDTITGATRGVGGTVTLDPDAWTTNAHADMRVSLTAFRTGIELRDDDLRQQFLNAAQFPQATLSLTSLEKASVQKLVPGQSAQVEAVGTLSLRSVSQPVRIPLSGNYDVVDGAPRLSVQGTFTVTLEDFGIPRPSRLFLKLGKDVSVTVRATMQAPSPTAARVATANAVTPAPLPATFLAPIVARAPKKPVVRTPKFAFAADTLEGKGERLFVDAKVGGAGNVVSCRACHGIHDERKGLADDDGTLPPANSLYNSAHRSHLWQGIATNAGNASSICAKLFMLRHDDLDANTSAALQAYLEKLSPDPAPPLNDEALHLTRTSAVNNPTGGDAKHGKALVGQVCARCHGEGHVRPELTPGLYEADMLVSRVRWLSGTDAFQMPPITIARLPDSDLRDIVTYLTADPKERIFQRTAPAVKAP